MTFSAAQVKELREKTGAGMMDAKKALVENNGDMEKAMEYLRQKGIASAEKKMNEVFGNCKIIAKKKGYFILSSVKESQKKMEFTQTQKEYFMKEAIFEANRAKTMGEVPIGCVIVSDQGKIIGRGHNLREHSQNATMHAEMLAI